MQFTTLLYAAVAFVGAASAQGNLNITNIDVSGLKLGVPFTVTWGSAKGTVTLTLQHGLDALALKTYEVLTTTGSFPDGSYVFTPGPDLPSDNYNFLIEDGVSKPNYSKQFQYFGTNPPSTTGGSNSTTATPSPPVSSDPSSTSASSTAARTSSKTSSNPPAQTSGSSPPPANNPGSAAGLASPIAMVFLGLAAFLAIN